MYEMRLHYGLHPIPSAVPLRLNQFGKNDHRATWILDMVEYLVAVRGMTTPRALDIETFSVCWVGDLDRYVCRDK